MIEQAVRDGRAVYGVTTGFGALANVAIGAAEADELQVNIVRSHAVGTGPPLSRMQTRALMVLLSDSLRRGHSGVREDVVQQVLDMLAEDVTPVIPSRGSVGASGDLAPLAHLALVLMARDRWTWAGAGSTVPSP